MSIPLTRHSMDDSDILAVIAAMKSGSISKGPQIRTFEKRMEDYCGVEYAIAVSSGSAALYCALLALDAGRADSVMIPPNTFVATANAALSIGSEVLFCDIQSGTGLIDPDCLAEKFAYYDPRIIIPVHYAGISCDMKSLYKLRADYGRFSIIEDAAHALGSHYAGEKVGCCRYSDISILSFGPQKTITTGEGGMCLTNWHYIANCLKRIRDNGLERICGDYIHESVGGNFRMSTMQASLGLSQMARIDEFLEKRAAIAYRYDMELDSSIVKLKIPDCVQSSNHIYPIFVSDNDHVMRQLFSPEIETRIHYKPVHLSPYFRNKGWSDGDFPNAERHGKTEVSLPIYPDLSYQDQSKVIEAINKIVSL